jgi:hypothetical protein
MARPTTAKQRVAGKEKVNYFVCVWLVGIKSNGACFPQIDETFAHECHGFDQVEFPSDPFFSKESANIRWLY